MDKTNKKYVNFIRYCNSTDLYSVDFVIAMFLMQNIHKIDSLSIIEVAFKSNTAVSSVSRFVKGAGFKNFKELKEMHIKNKNTKHKSC